MAKTNERKSKIRQMLTKVKDSLSFESAMMSHGHSRKKAGQMKKDLIKAVKTKNFKTYNNKYSKGK